MPILRSGAFLTARQMINAKCPQCYAFVVWIRRRDVKITLHGSCCRWAFYAGPTDGTDDNFHVKVALVNLLNVVAFDPEQRASFSKAFAQAEDVSSGDEKP